MIMIHIIIKKIIKMTCWITINIKTIDHNENINSNSKKNKDNNYIIENYENIINKRNSNKNEKK